MEEHFENSVIFKEYERCLKAFDVDDPYKTESTLGIHDVLRAHFLIVDAFYSMGTGLGGIGPRDNNLLHSAVYRQFVSFGGKDKWKDNFEKAATLIYGVICDHPFHDANKRTGLLLLLLFLRKQNRAPTLRHRQLEDFAVDVSNHNLQKYRRFRKLRKRYEDAEVLFIADYMKRHSRIPQGGYKRITYRQLNQRLNELGYKLDNPRNNFIDLVRIEERRRLLGFGRKESMDVKVAQIGFPGWKKQVNPGAISTIRKKAKLKKEHGVDSGTFYEGLDPIPPLLAEYSNPLERLADR